MNIKKNYKQMKQGIILVSLVLSFLALTGCFTVKVSSKGTNIPPYVKTFSVQYFSNRAQLVEPNFSQTFTDELIEYIESNTSLRYVSGIGDVDFSGTVVTYQITPQAITGGNGTNGTLSAMTRFSIGIKFDYMDTKDQEKDFNKSVSAYREFESSQAFSSEEPALSEEIREELIDQIFNAAFVNW